MRLKGKLGYFICVYYFLKMGEEMEAGWIRWRGGGRVDCERKQMGGKVREGYKMYK